MAARPHDPARIRAVAHPLRLAILREMWDVNRPVRAVDLAEALGEPANSISYHVRKLRDAGYVVDVEGPEGSTGRDHWYAAPERAIVIDRDTRDDAELNDAAAWLSHVLYQQMAAIDSAAQAAGEGPLIHADGSLWLTRDVAAKYVERLSDLLAEMRTAASEAHLTAEPGTLLTRYAALTVLVPEQRGGARLELPVEEVTEPPEPDPHAL